MDRLPEYIDMSNVDRASRIIYLNKTCFNGLYRVNSSGQYNTPFGRYENPRIVNGKVLRSVSKYFNESDITFTSGDFADAISNVTRSSFVYLDPPYDPLSKTSSFKEYSKRGFTDEDQIRVRNACIDINEKGAKFLLSNSATDFTLDLYRGFDITIVDAIRTINSDATKRGVVKEILVKNY